MAEAYFGRLLTAMVTPFNADGSVNCEAAADFAEWLLANGSDGLVVEGSTGEAATMFMDEKIAVLKSLCYIIGADKKLKDEEKLVRQEMDITQDLRKIVYLTGEKYKFFMMCFSVFVIFVIPVSVVLFVWLAYTLYNRRLIKKTKEYVND